MHCLTPVCAVLLYGGCCCRFGLILLGNPRVLSRQPLWNALLTHFKEHVSACFPSLFGVTEGGGVGAEAAGWLHVQIEGAHQALQARSLRCFSHQWTNIPTPGGAQCPDQLPKALRDQVAKSLDASFHNPAAAAAHRSCWWRVPSPTSSPP